MDSSDVIQLLILLILLLLSAFFSSSETALTTVNKIRMRNLAEDGDGRAQTVLKIVENPGKMLSAILIGNNIVNLSASSLATTLAIGIGGNKLVGIATGVLTLLILVLAETIALRFARPIYIVMWVLTPVIFIVNKFSYAVLFILRVDPNRKQEGITEDELRTIVEVSHEEGVIESEEKKMINNVFDFGDAVAKDVMVPRIDMAFVDVESTREELLDIFREEKYTRYPVYEDTTDNVIGIINIKDIFLADGEEEFDLRKYLRQPYYTYEFKKVSELMLEMRKATSNIVIVLDEYGATAGLITLEDMLEEIVGEIRDEYDEDEEEAFIRISENEYLVEGAMKLDDLNDRLDTHLESEDYDSIGGLVIGLLDHLPEEGEEVTFGNLRLVVEKVEKNRIDTIHLYILQEEDESGEEAPAEK